MTRWRRVHRIAVWLHRWTGLVIALFLILCSATGSVLAFQGELDALLTPALHRVTTAAARGPMLDPLVVRERLLAAYPRTTIDWVDLDTKRDAPMVFVLAAEPKSPPLQDDEIFVDPYDGRILGARRNGDLTQGLVNLVPFVDRLHTSLALGPVGAYVLGVVALLWTLDCFVGFYLTLPAPHDRRPGSRARPRATWLQRWRHAWRVRWGAGATKLNFDWHRASGLWLWPLLFVFAWSSVGFNLRAVYEPVMQATTGYRPDPVDAPREVPVVPRATDFAAARARARVLMADVARQHGFVVRRERLIHYDATHGTYGYRTLSSLDVDERLGSTNLTFDARDGRLLRVDLPTGQRAGNTIDTWLGALHTALVWGLPMQIVVCATGLAVAALSATGLVVWWQRRRARRTVRARRERPNATVARHDATA